MSRYPFDHDAASDPASWQQDESGLASPRLAIVTGFHCYEVAKLLSCPYRLDLRDMRPSDRPRGDGSRATFKFSHNGRGYVCTVTPDMGD